eukprot:TRINITY_DN2_c0_g1_i4.p1 TRINITY_DN2_c0_g1~~TRINITY_DN2_c0_g1_i4.p1  ORF type:complete len:592 (+),score=144.91 TRINITY_DN2_c0_g1_i4:205-1776(+)
MKWFFIQALPLMAAALFLTIHIVKWSYKRLILQNKMKVNRHVSVLISVFFVTFYYLYLYLLRMQLEIFNCTETEPDDGHTYTEFSSTSCDGLCRCWESGGIHLQLLPWALLTFIVFSLGFPAIVTWIIWKNRQWIQLDQLLRAYGFNDSQRGRRVNRVEVGDECYDLRRRYSRLYYHFKPSHFYWIVIIIGRKFLIAGTSLLFRKNASFQMAMCLLVMFAAYALHVRHSPYMSPSEYTQLIEKYERGNGINLFPIQKARLDHILASSNANQRGRRVTRIDGMHQIQTSNRTLNFFWNYNTVEMVLLGCSVFVNLAGIMFESGDIGTSYYDAQRKLLVYVTIFVILGSIVYLGMVLVSEIMTTVRGHQPKTYGKNRSLSDKSPTNRNSSKSPSVNKSVFSEDVDLSKVDLCYNPMVKQTKPQNDNIDADAKNKIHNVNVNQLSNDPKRMVVEQERKIMQMREELVTLKRELRSYKDGTRQLPSKGGGLGRKRLSSRMMTKKTHGFVRPHRDSTLPIISATGFSK